MTPTTPGGIGEYTAAYRAGASVTGVIERVLDALDRAPPGVLIGSALRSALDGAAALDAGGPTDRPLHGVPFLVKDNIDVAGAATTAGCPGYSYVAAGDAAVVARLRAAGAIVVGKANLDQFATGLVGTRSPYGTPPNAVDLTLVPGGSSSGSAVAVALGLVPFALGTDTTGSGRVPAALNGVVGYKPSVGRWSTDGIVPAVPRLDCPSVFARSVGDAAVVAAVLDGDHPEDAANHTAAPGVPWIVGIAAPWPAAVELDEAVRAGLERSIGRFGDIGAVVLGVDAGPLLALGDLLYGSALVAERTAAIGDAIAPGTEGLDPIVAHVIRRGREYTAVDAYRAEAELARRRRAADLVLAGIDVLALPTTGHLPRLVDVAADPVGENERVGRLTTFVNLLGRPVLVVPVNRGEPVGIQLIGAAGRDRELRRVARQFAGEDDVAVVR